MQLSGLKKGTAQARRGLWCSWVVTAESTVQLIEGVAAAEWPPRGHRSIPWTALLQLSGLNKGTAQARRGLWCSWVVAAASTVQLIEGVCRRVASERTPFKHLEGITVASGHMPEIAPIYGAGSSRGPLSRCKRGRHGGDKARGQSKTNVLPWAIGWGYTPSSTHQGAKSAEGGASYAPYQDHKAYFRGTPFY